MGGGLDLAALVAMFERGQHATQPVDLGELAQYTLLDCLFDAFHAGRSRQRIHEEFKQAGFLQEDGLGLRR